MENIKQKIILLSQFHYSLLKYYTIKTFFSNTNNSLEFHGFESVKICKKLKFKEFYVYKK